VTDSTADGPVTGDGAVGGLVGYNFGSTVEGSTANGAVSGTVNVGGLVGYNLAGTITTSQSTGDVTASGGQRVGGLVGFNDGGGSTVRESFATGSVTGGDDAGGLVGQNRDDAIVDSYALGDVDGDANVGCLVGNNTGSGATVETSYAACSVSGSSNVGGLIGLTANGATVTDSYWDTDEDGDTSDGGEGLPTANMTGANAESNMTGFDFTNTWLAEPVSYPELESNTRTTEPGGDEGDTEGSGDDTPDITNYEVRADGSEITVSFDSDENLVEVTVEISGAETATLDRDDFSGDTYSGFAATYAADTDGSYTVELTEARDSSNNDGTEGETFRRSVTVRAEDDNGTATPTDNGTATPTDGPDTPTPTATDGPDTPTPTATDEPDTPTPTATDEPDTPTPTQPEDAPGFGAIVTLLALLGAALLASRRRDGAA
jgi:PGF-CTERM protein